MAFSTETIGRLLASGRNYTSTIVGFIGGIGLMSAAQQKGFMDALNEIFNGLSQIAHGATSLWQILVVAFPIIGVWMASIASKSAKVDSQAAAVQAAAKDPNTVVSKEATASILDAAAEASPLAKPILVTDPALADMVPSAKVKSV
jgi:hypothetical protein